VPNRLSISAIASSDSCVVEVLETLGRAR
jgi:hypothetical protein